MEEKKSDIGITLTKKKKLHISKIPTEKKKPNLNLTLIKDEKIGRKYSSNKKKTEYMYNTNE